MINVICYKCGGGRDVSLSTSDLFTWQCQYCMTRQEHIPEVEDDIVEVKYDIIEVEDDIVEVEKWPKDDFEGTEE